MILERIAASDFMCYRRLLLESLPSSGLIGLHVPPTLLTEIVIFALFGLRPEQQPGDILRIGQPAAEVELDLDGMRLVRSLDRQGAQQVSLTRLEDQTLLAEGVAAVTEAIGARLGFDTPEALRRRCVLGRDTLERIGAPEDGLLRHISGLDRLIGAAELARRAERDAENRLEGIEDAIVSRRNAFTQVFDNEPSRTAYQEQVARLQETEQAAEQTREQIERMEQIAGASEAVGRTLAKLTQNLLGNSDDAALLPAQNQLHERYRQLQELRRLNNRQIGELVDQVESSVGRADRFSMLRLEMDKLRNMVANRGRHISRAIDPNPQRDRGRTDRQLLADNLLLKIRAAGALEQRVTRGMRVTLAGAVFCAIGSVFCLALANGGAQGSSRSTLLISGVCLVLATGLLSWVATFLRGKQLATREAKASMEVEAQLKNRQGQTCLHFNSDRLSSALAAAEMVNDEEILEAAQKLEKEFPEALGIQSISKHHDMLSETLRDERNQLKQAEEARGTSEKLLARLERELPQSVRLGELEPSQGPDALAIDGLTETIEREILEYQEAQRRRRVLARSSGPPLAHSWEELMAATRAFSAVCPEERLNPGDLLDRLVAADEALDGQELTELIAQLSKSIGEQLPSVGANAETLLMTRERLETLYTLRDELGSTLGAQAEPYALARAMLALQAEQRTVTHKHAIARRAQALLEEAAARLETDCLPSLRAALPESADPLTAQLMLLLICRQAALDASTEPHVLICEGGSPELAQVLDEHPWRYSQVLISQPAPDIPQLAHILRPEQDGEALLWKGREDLWSPVGPAKQ